MKISDFLEMSVEDLDKMPKEQLHKEMKMAAGTLNRRYQNIRSRARQKKGNVPSQEAVREAARTGGRFSLRGTKVDGNYNMPKIRREFARMKKFYKSEASTVRGAQKRAKEISEQWFGEGVESGLTGGQLGELRQKENRAYELSLRMKELGGDKYKETLESIEKVRSDAQRGGWTYQQISEALDRVIEDYEKELNEVKPDEEESGLWAARARRTKK